MIRKAEELSVAYNEHMRGGDGTVIVRKFIRGPEDLCGKGRLFANITLNPGCGIGFHVHEGESELFYIMKGGDVTICPPGTGHGITNRTDEVVEVIAVIVND